MLKLDFSSTRTKNFQMYKLGLEKGEEPELKLPTSAGSWRWRKQGNSRKTAASTSLTTRKSFDFVTTNWNILKEMGITDHHTHLLRKLYEVKKQQLEPDIEPQTGAKLGKEYIRLHIVTLFI